MNAFIKLDELNDETKVIEMELQNIDDMDLTVILASEELTKQMHMRYYCKHGLTMLMMYEATNIQRYLQQARLDYHQAKLLQDPKFVLSTDSILAA